MSSACTTELNIHLFRHNRDDRSMEKAATMWRVRIWIVHFNAWEDDVVVLNRDKV